MKRLRRLLTAVTLLLIVVAACARAQGQPQPLVEPEAMTALTKMGAYLRTLKAFQVQAVTSSEDVLEDGQKVQFDGVTDMLARMPDRLLISVNSDRQDRTYVYDGKQFTMLAKRMNYYATIPAPNTIALLSDTLDEKYGLVLPLEDLFRWGGPQSKDDTIKGAMFVGPSEIAGVTCGHYAFRQDGLDWQVWIQMGDYPLPRKLVLTTRTDEARPQYVATFTWNLAPSFDEDAFAFVPLKGTGRVVIPELK